MTRRAPPVAPQSLFEPGRRHLVVLAHQDDELPYAGTLRRMRPDLRVVFLTNGDGLAHEAGLPLDTYAALRRAESTAALGALGVQEDRLVFLGFSEVTNYARFAQMRAEPATTPAGALFEEQAAAVYREVRACAPDVVWTLAWQGGHPEHDLAHLATVRSVRAWDAETGRTTPIFAFPAYELGIVAFRLRPWDPRPRLRIRLTGEELDLKQQLLGMYPTQQRVIDQLTGVVAGLGRAAALVGRGFSMREFFANEEFGPVETTDYTRSTHVSARLDYPFDDYKGVPIRFDRTLARIGAQWFGGGGG